MKELKKLKILFFKKNLVIENNLDLNLGNLIFIYNGYESCLGFVSSIKENQVNIFLNGDLKEKTNLRGMKYKEDVGINFGGKNLGTIKNIYGEEFRKNRILYSEGGSEEFVSFQSYKIFNPINREIPSKPFFTGIGLIDLFMTIIKGQKISVFISEEYKVIEMIKKLILDKKEKIFLCLVGLGEEDLLDLSDFIEKNRLSEYFILYNSNRGNYSDKKYIYKLFNNLCNKYLEKNPKSEIISIIFDFSEYGNYLRNESIDLKELPGKKGYPYDLYSSFAGIFENCGSFKNGGSITMINMLKIQKGDVTNIFSDISGYISEGQIVIDQENLIQKFKNPINIFQSLSRLMNEALENGNISFDNHLTLAYHLKRLYFEAKGISNLAGIIGFDNLDVFQKKMIDFKNIFEKEFYHSEGIMDLHTISKKCYECLETIPEKEKETLGEEIMKNLRNDI